MPHPFQKQKNSRQIIFAAILTATLKRRAGLSRFQTSNEL
jgi:hypothetical protein